MKIQVSCERLWSFERHNVDKVQGTLDGAPVLDDA
jgi:hypothetical protein